jgi:hypothetical protein
MRILLENPTVLVLIKTNIVTIMQDVTEYGMS